MFGLSLLFTIFLLLTKAGEASKDVLVTFSGGESITLRLSIDLYTPTQEKVQPPIQSSTIRVEVLSVHTQANNGFSEIMVWEVVL